LAGLKVEQVGLSQLQREIYQIEWGNGPLKVFLWSQMHGDEPTATSALVDLFAILQSNRESEWAGKISSSLTLRAVPMLNPDGADLYQRRNIS
ncbi:M14 family zinc carboxypeptidase, partial [Escherichia coli]|nr:M14 family zinc carboxypeptidase [Escherichia coli]